MIGQTVVDVFADAFVRAPIVARAAPAMIRAAQSAIAQTAPLRLFVAEPRSDLVRETIPPTALTPAHFPRPFRVAFAAPQSPIAAPLVVIIAVGAAVVIAWAARAVVVAFVIAPVIACVARSAVVIARSIAFVTVITVVITLGPPPVTVFITAIGLLPLVTGIAHACGAVVIAPVVLSVVIAARVVATSAARCAVAAALIASALVVVIVAACAQFFVPFAVTVFIIVTS